jgi:hypothetical protein
MHYACTHLGGCLFGKGQHDNVFWEQLRVSLQECDIPFGQLCSFASTCTGDDRDNCLTGERSESVLDLFELALCRHRYSSSALVLSTVASQMLK